ncbi:MAG: TlpA disulfide reductase family protein [Saprospiraceae bacterium]
MNVMIRSVVLAVLAMVVLACGPKGLTISGKIENATNLQVFLDEVKIGKASNILSKTDMAEDGTFSLQFEEGLPAGIYNVRIGAKRINLILNGEEKEVSITGNLETLQNYDITVSGSGDSQTFVQVMQGLFRRQYKPEDITAMVDTVANPYLATFIAYTALGNKPEFVSIHKKASSRLNDAYPGSEAATAYASYISNLELNAAAMQRQLGPITVGMEAPNIQLPNPQGKMYSLADLKGKVVLLDFWASWCGPCRRENPNVVDVYNRYKDQGFTVFSVSLDGLDSRSKARYAAADLDRAMATEKQKWVNAIQQDGLAWEYHVSDLLKWETTAGAMYGVSSIPRTFLIDREGKIAAVNLRGAEAIEAALKEII